MGDAPDFGGWHHGGGKGLNLLGEEAKEALSLCLPKRTMLSSDDSMRRP